MADITIYGHIVGIRYTESNVIVSVSEFQKGYRKKNGELVNDSVYTYVVGFANFFRAYIADHFDKGMLVKVKGTILPFAKNKNGETIEGYTINGQTINLASYPSNSSIKENKLLKESQSHAVGTPNLSEFEKEDF